MTEVARERIIQLEKIERITQAIVSYYSDVDLAAHLSALDDEGLTYSPDGVVRKVWINHKLVDAFSELRKELGL